MDTHFRGPAKNGQGAAVVQRGTVFNFGDAAETRELLTVENPQLDKFPILVEVNLTRTVAFNGTGAALSVQVTPEGGSAADLIATAVGAGETIARRICFARDKFTVVFAPGTTPTTGKAVVFIKAAGCGQL